MVYSYFSQLYYLSNISVVDVVLCSESFQFHNKSLHKKEDTPASSLKLVHCLSRCVQIHCRQKPPNKQEDLGILSAMVSMEESVLRNQHYKTPWCRIPPDPRKEGRTDGCSLHPGLQAWPAPPPPLNMCGVR